MLNHSGKKFGSGGALENGVAPREQDFTVGSSL
jgi:hypothetical protein